MNEEDDRVVDCWHCMLLMGERQMVGDARERTMEASEGGGDQVDRGSVWIASDEAKRRRCGACPASSCWDMTVVGVDGDVGMRGTVGGYRVGAVERAPCMWRRYAVVGDVERNGG